MLNVAYFLSLLLHHIIYLSRWPKKIHCHLMLYGPDSAFLFSFSVVMSNRYGMVKIWGKSGYAQYGHLEDSYIWYKDDEAFDMIWTWQRFVHDMDMRTIEIQYRHEEILTAFPLSYKLCLIDHTTYMRLTTIWWCIALPIIKQTCMCKSNVSNITCGLCGKLVWSCQ